MCHKGFLITDKGRWITDNNIMTNKDNTMISIDITKDC